MSSNPQVQTQFKELYLQNAEHTNYLSAPIRSEYNSTDL